MSSIIQTIRKMNNGALAMDLERAMAEVTQGVTGTRGKGKLSLDLTVEFEDEECGRYAIKITPEIKVKVPRAKRSAQTHYVYADDTGALRMSRRDPAQPELPGMPADEDEPQGRSLSVIEGQRSAAADTA